jgi:hypothetical protein
VQRRKRLPPESADDAVRSSRRGEKRRRQTLAADVEPAVRHEPLTMPDFWNQGLTVVDAGPCYPVAIQIHILSGHRQPVCALSWISHPSPRSGPLQSCLCPATTWNVIRLQWRDVRAIETN